MFNCMPLKPVTLRDIYELESTEFTDSVRQIDAGLQLYNKPKFYLAPNSVS